jgi:serine/threonine protein kinase
VTEDVFGIVGSTQAGIFRVERVVAEGGFAVVYRAYHEGFRAPVALKCLKVPDSMREEKRVVFLERFRAEGELLFRLSALEAAVVRPLHVDVLVLGQRIVPFLALEWLEGEALDQRIVSRRVQGKAPIEIHKLCAFLQPAARAFAQAHRVPAPDGPIAIIHRDIKPENLFVVQTPAGEVVKILDFGIARTMRAAQLDAGAVAAGAGVDAFTPGYAAPEQWMPQRFGQVGPWTDVFGLAVTMLEVLSAQRVFQGDVTAMAQQTIDPVRRPTLRALGVAVADTVEQVFARALAVHPRERTQSIMAFWTELETALGMPHSISAPDTRGPVRVLTGDYEPPPALAQLANGGPQRAFSPLANTAPPMRVGLRKPEGDVLPPSSRRPTPEAIHIELAKSQPAPAHPAPQPSAAAPPSLLDLAPAAPRHQGTLLPPMRTGGARALATLREQLVGPVTLVLLAIAITVGDTIYTQRTGEMLALGPARPAWIAAPLALLGVGLACWRVLGAL